jgi:hypothetical protein
MKRVCFALTTSLVAVAAWPRLDASVFLNRVRVQSMLVSSTRRSLHPAALRGLRDSGLVVCLDRIPDACEHTQAADFRGNQILYLDRFQWYPDWLKCELGVPHYRGSISDLLPAPREQDHEPTVVIALRPSELSINLKHSLTALAEESVFYKRFVVVAIAKDETMAAELLALNGGEKVAFWSQVARNR